MKMKTRSTRIDVQTKINRIIELMQRPQGASVKEICAELECAEKTFYRHLEKLAVQNVPYITRPDPDGKTNSVRYYIIKSAIKGSNVFLSASEKALLRLIIQNSKSQIESEKENKKLAESILEKLNDGVIHDTKESEIKLIQNSFSAENKWAYDETFTLLSEALELKQSISFKTKTWGIHAIKHEKIFRDIEKKIVFQIYTLINDQGHFWAMGKVVPVEPLEESEKPPVDIWLIRLISIKDIKIHKQYPYSIPQDYDYEYWYRYYHGGMKNKRIVHLSLDHQAAWTFWHESGFEPKAIYKYGSRLHVFIETYKLNELKRYVLGLGSRVKVISPEDFKNEITEETEKIKNCYGIEISPEKFLEKQELSISLESIERQLYPYGNATMLKALFREWWRYDLDLHQSENELPVSHSLFCFQIPELRKVIAVVKNYENENSFRTSLHIKSSRLQLPFSTIFYEDRIAYEVPFEDVIDYDMDFFLPVLEKYCAQNLPENFEQMVAENKGLDEKTKKEILKRKEKYAHNKPMLLLTGIDRIKSEWADEILRKGTFHGIPTHAVLLKEECSEDGTLNITAYKY